MNKAMGIISMGVSHLLVSFTSIVVVTRILGFNIPIAFLFAGIGTILFHFITKNKLPIVLGVSGMYIGALLHVTQAYGFAYAMGGLLVSGLVYIVFGIAMFKYQNKILKYLPDWLLSTTVALIGLSLLPIGITMISGNLLIGLFSFATVVVVDLVGKGKLKLFALPLGVLVGTLIALATNNLDYSVLSATQSLSMSFPKFSLGAILTISPLTIAVMFENLGDIKNQSDAMGMDVFKEVGSGRIFIGNGVATFLGGLFGANAMTTYSENTAFVVLSKYYNPLAQLVTAVLMIVVAFVTPISNALMLIPSQALGGVVVYLFAMMIINSIKSVVETQEFRYSSKVRVIVTAMVAMSFMTFAINGISISSVAIATFVGMTMNAIFRRC